MKKLFRWVLVSMFAVVALQAQAQRMPVPVVDFVDVPVPATATPATAERVKTAFLRAAATLNWDVTPVSDGVLEAKFVKEFKHTVVATVRYTAQGYSVAYKSSDNMKFEDGPNVTSPGVRAAPSLMLSAHEAQRKLFVNDPFTPYAVVRTDGALHPFYEVWVRRLMAAVNGELKAG